MKKYLITILLSAISLGAVHASILASDSFDYTIGSADTTWNGGTGFSGRWDVSSATGLQGEIVTGLTFGTMSVSGNALWSCFSQSASGLGSSTVFRATNFGAVSSGDVWMSYLYQFDAASSVNLSEVAMQVRLSTILRSGINEDTSAFTVKYNASAQGTSGTDAVFKDGTTLLMVFAFPDLGAATGTAAKGWALTVSGYESLISLGITEANLDACALITVTSAFDDNTTLASGTQLQVVPLARNAGSVSAFTIDELKIGTAISDVIAIPEPQVAALLLSISALFLVRKRARH